MENKKEYYKITFQDFDIASEFFDNEKQLSEFILATIYYYQGKEFSIKNKLVQKYFRTYKKTMDFIINAKGYGKLGKTQIIENEQDKDDTLEGYVEGTLSGLDKGTFDYNSKVIKDNIKEINDKVKEDNQLNIYESILEYYHGTCIELPKVIRITDKRKKRLDTIIKNEGKSVLKQVFDLTAESDFLSGRSGEWIANLDWILKPENMIKILEGNYKNKIKNNGKSTNSIKDLDPYSALERINERFKQQGT